MTRFALLSAVGLLCASCMGDGWFVIGIEGKHIQDGLNTAQVSDEWSIRFERFEVTIASLTVLDENARPLTGYAHDPAAPIDLADPSAAQGLELTGKTTGGAPAGEVSWQVAPVVDSGGTTPAYFIRGTAQKGSDIRTFGWQLQRDTRYSDCPLGPSRQHLTLTIDASPLFTDTLGTISFGAFAAADRDGDGELAEAELRSALPLDGLGANLYETLEARSRNLGFMFGNEPCLTVQ
jgi:hypothetical protein